MQTPPPQQPAHDKPKRLPPRHCLRCGYALTALPEDRCPECGLPFNPQNPRTFLTSRAPVLRRCLGPPTWFELILAVALTLLLIEASSRPLITTRVHPCIRFAHLCLPAAALLVIWLGRLLISTRYCVVDWSKHWRWAVLPICLLLLIATVLTITPLRVLRFRLSEPALTAEARLLLGRPPRPAHQQQGHLVGWYWVHEVQIDQFNQRVWFILERDGTLREGRLLYAPDLKPPDPPLLPSPAWRPLWIAL